MPGQKIKEMIADLILSGSGSRVAWQLGAWHVIREEVDITSIHGTSAGAMLGLMIACHREPSLKDIRRTFSISPLSILTRKGIASQRRLYDLMRPLCGDHLFVPFSCCTTDMTTGDAEYKVAYGSDTVDESLIDMVVASSSYPGVYPHVLGKYADGGLVDAVPFFPSISGSENKVVLYAMPEEMPPIKKGIVNRFFAGNEVLNRTVGTYDLHSVINVGDIVIRPSKNLPGRMNFGRKEAAEMFELGIRDAKSSLMQMA